MRTRGGGRTAVMALSDCYTVAQEVGAFAWGNLRRNYFWDDVGSRNGRRFRTYGVNTSHFSTRQNTIFPTFPKPIIHIVHRR